MSELQAKLDAYKAKAMAQLEGVGETNIDDELVTKLVSNLRLVIDNNDALLVSGTDPSELETVRRNFVVKKLGVDDKEKAMEVIHAVAEKMKPYRMKNRAAFYYLVQKHLG